MPEIATITDTSKAHAEFVLARHDIDVPHIHEYFGAWCIEENAFRLAVGQVNTINIQAHVAASVEEGVEAAGASVTVKGQRRNGYTVVDGVAVLTMSGPMMKFTSSLSGGVSTAFLRRSLRAAVNDTEVRGILMVIDSPGGTVSGTDDLAEDVANAAKRKPVFAFVEDLGASAAYWVASQATQIHANKTALVGSIGTFAVIHDLSEMAEQMGVKVHVLRAGDFKGAGTAGTEITDDQLAEWQRIVNELNSFFLKGVARGRGMEMNAVRELADGRVHVGSKAKALGLIDQVTTFEQTLADVRRASKQQHRSPAESSGGNTETSAMSDESTTTTKAESSPKPATLAELKSKLPMSTAEFRETALEQAMTMEQAALAWAEHAQAALEARDLENEQLKSKTATLEEEATAAKAKKPGVPAAGGNAKADSTEGKSGDGSATARWNELVEANVKLGMSRKLAVSKAAREHDDVRKDMVEEANARRRAG